VRWSARSGRPAVFCHLGLPHRQSVANRRGRLAILHRAIEGAAAVVAPSRTARDAFDRWLGVEARVIHPPVAVDHLRAGERAAEPTIVWCDAGRSSARLVEAFGLVRRRHPAARLVLPDPSGVQGAAGVEVRPLDDPAVLAAAYAEAWVGALSCAGEGFCTAAAEVLACGAPVVGPDRDALPEVIDRPELGRLFAGEDAESIADALLEALELAQDPATPGACRARAEDFSVERCTDAHLALYAELGVQSSSVR
jgi:glycosyltransferase involved in cell wall biosynthesis